eukprot:scaffold111361_cov19-Prasinocladus_malaysianus.AAC.2
MAAAEVATPSFAFVGAVFCFVVHIRNVFSSGAINFILVCHPALIKALVLQPKLLCERRVELSILRLAHFVIDLPQITADSGVVVTHTQGPMGCA